MKRALIVFLLIIALFSVFGSADQSRVFADPVEIPIEEGPTPLISLDIFNPTKGWADVGILSMAGLIARFIFMLLMVVWIALIIYAGAIMVKSEGGDDMKIQMKRIRNIWIGISAGLGFFILVSLIGFFAGVGNVFQWSENLRDCSCENAVVGETCHEYLFQGRASVEDSTKFVWRCHEGTDTVRNMHLDGKGWQAE